MLWSIFTRYCVSSTFLLANDTYCVPLFGRGSSAAATFMATGSIRLSGIWLLENGALVLNGSTSCVFGSRAEKSPMRCAAVGTVIEIGLGADRCNVSWPEKKKN